MKLEAFKKAFPYTIPIFLGYLFLGIGLWSFTCQQRIFFWAGLF
jgi:predicted branched-subunit amino acid permease